MVKSAPYIAPFPPSIATEPFAYGLALFSDLLVCALCLAHLLGLLLDGRRKRQTLKMLPETHKGSDQFPLFSTLNVRRQIVVGFLLTLLLRALPDAGWMLAWGEATKATMDFLFVLDWWGDVGALVTCVCSLGLLAWSGQAIDQRLAAVSMVPLAPPKWAQARQYLLILAVVVLIAIGVTVGKASA